ncbi:MAG TPA: hypothetical protein VK879_12225 [Candidatus Sulfomarinibacteraceae bacterium]|nr:hypothetical protein [Candidatus Sulfomarinibacteraceae bacterium]
MRLERQKEQELAQRKGFASRTIVQTIWLLISGAIGYFVLRWLFDAGTLEYNLFYNTLGIPRAVPEEVIFAGLILLIVIIMQFFLILGYAFASPAGRERPGTPSPYSSSYDPMQDDYRH